MRRGPKLKNFFYIIRRPFSMYVLCYYSHSTVTGTFFKLKHACNIKTVTCEKFRPKCFLLKFSHCKHLFFLDINNALSTPATGCTLKFFQSSFCYYWSIFLHKRKRVTLGADTRISYAPVFQFVYLRLQILSVLFEKR